MNDHPLLFRSTDPATSREAAASHAGKAGSNRAEVFACVQQNPGQTSAEVAARLDMERHEAARRLPELEQTGVVRKGAKRECRVNHTQAVTWWPTGGGRYRV